MAINTYRRDGARCLSLDMKRETMLIKNTGCSTQAARWASHKALCVCMGAYNTTLASHGAVRQQQCRSSYADMHAERFPSSLF